jgi:hypothetical protein
MEVCVYYMIEIRRMSPNRWQSEETQSHAVTFNGTLAGTMASGLEECGTLVLVLARAFFERALAMPFKFGS